MSVPVSEAELAILLARLDEAVPDARGGLPQDLFYLVSRLTPLVNVDLLIRDGDGRVLLTWRADEFYGPGWHVPGGIIRFKETAAARIVAVASNELGAEVRADPAPFIVREIMSPCRDVRGHFISLLYCCTLITPLNMALKFIGDRPDNGMWCWFERCPDNLIPAHEIYRSHIDAPLLHPSDNRTDGAPCYEA